MFLSFHSTVSSSAATTVAGPSGDDAAKEFDIYSKQRRTRDEVIGDTHLEAMDAPRPGGTGAPIDLIFRFHAAFNQELCQLGDAARRLRPYGDIPGMLQTDVGPDAAGTQADEASASDASYSALVAFQGRFEFMQGTYKAHSACEDDVVFKALEGKAGLGGVGRSYSLDHEHEEELFVQASHLPQPPTTAIRLFCPAARSPAPLQKGPSPPCQGFACTAQAAVGFGPRASQHPETRDLTPLPRGARWGASCASCARAPPRRRRSARPCCSPSCAI